MCVCVCGGGGGGGWLKKRVSSVLSVGSAVYGHTRTWWGGGGGGGGGEETETVIIKPLDISLSLNNHHQQHVALSRLS